LVLRDDKVIGIAPLRRKGDTVRFIGSANVCDYLDFIVADGKEFEFFTAVFDELKSAGVRRLELESLRPDSKVMTHLLPLARERSLPVESEDTDVTLEMPLPDDWVGYLAALSTHQRHEIKRKGRRLGGAGTLEFDIKPPQDIEGELRTLLRLLRISRQDKDDFMTEEMESYFDQLSAAMHEAGWLRFGHLKLDGQTVASIMCFDYNGTRYLYNSGYEPERSGLSVGLLSKVYSIQDAIEQKMIRYDFLKGAEVYKYHLGGREMPISRCRIELSGGW
jgi:CelD/BcsL family acetyltransferase involved in cellulose biosynthesis